MTHKHSTLHYCNYTQICKKKMIKLCHALQCVFCTSVKLQSEKSGIVNSIFVRRQHEIRVVFKDEEKVKDGCLQRRAPTATLGRSMQHYYNQ